MAQPCVNVMLVYPDGLAEEDGGNISIIRGSHFFRAVTDLSAGSGEVRSCINSFCMVLASTY